MDLKRGKAPATFCREIGNGAYISNLPYLSPESPSTEPCKYTDFQMGIFAISLFFHQAAHIDSGSIDVFAKAKLRPGLISALVAHPH